MTASLLEWGVTAAVLSAAWIGVVLLVRRPVSRWLGAQWAYRLWLLPIVAIAATLVPSHPLRQAFEAGGIAMPLLDTLNASLFELTQSVGPSTRLAAPGSAATGPLAATDGLLLIWLAGLLLLLLPFVLRHFQSSARLLAASRKLSGDELRRLRSNNERLAARPLAALRLLDTTAGPAVAGFMNPVLLLPRDFFTRFDPQQQALILEHEFEHLRRNDLVVLMLARIYRSLFWFNPLAHVAEPCLRLDQESSCDERVLQCRHPSVRRRYGETLLLSTQERFPQPVQAAWSSYSQIRPRLFMLRRHGQTPARRRAGRAVLLASLAFCCVLGALADPQLGGNPQARQALLRQAEFQYRSGDRVSALQVLAQSERLSPAGLPAHGQALRSRIYIDLGWWEQAYAAIDAAIERAEAAGDAPQESWLLARTALQWKLGDLEGAARSLERSMATSLAIPSAASYERTLALFNDLVQDTWEPPAAEQTLAKR